LAINADFLCQGRLATSLVNGQIDGIGLCHERKLSRRIIFVKSRENQLTKNLPPLKLSLPDRRDLRGGPPMHHPTAAAN